jgi:hypothetical protein
MDYCSRQSVANDKKLLYRGGDNVDAKRRALLSFLFQK